MISPTELCLTNIVLSDTRFDLSPASVDVHWNNPGVPYFATIKLIVEDPNDPANSHAPYYTLFTRLNKPIFKYRGDTVAGLLTICLAEQTEHDLYQKCLALDEGEGKHFIIYAHVKDNPRKHLYVKPMRGSMSNGSLAYLLSEDGAETISRNQVKRVIGNFNFHRFVQHYCAVVEFGVIDIRQLLPCPKLSKVLKGLTNSYNLQAAYLDV